MFIAELHDDQWLECLPLDLDIYFEEIAGPKLDLAEDLIEEESATVVPFIRDSEIYRHVAFLITVAA